MNSHKALETLDYTSKNSNEPHANFQLIQTISKTLNINLTTFFYLYKH